MTDCKIFISYRQTDSRLSAKFIYFILSIAYGKECIFRDDDSIAKGENWSQGIFNALQTSKVILIVMGKNWLTKLDGVGSPRIFQPDDILRKEIEFALDSKKILIPVLVNGAEIPASQDLPPTISKIYEIQAFNLIPHLFIGVTDLLKTIDNNLKVENRLFRVFFNLGKWLKRIAALALVVFFVSGVKPSSVITFKEVNDSISASRHNRDRTGITISLFKKHLFSLLPLEINQRAMIPDLLYQVHHIRKILPDAEKNLENQVQLRIDLEKIRNGLNMIEDSIVMYYMVQDPEKGVFQAFDIENDLQHNKTKSVYISKAFAILPARSPSNIWYHQVNNELSEINSILIRNNLK